MENSENKSLIPTGRSNLAKTEKLLSITQKILSEIKPQYDSIKIGNQEWMNRNLDVDRFRNGDLIPHVESDEEWVKAGENGEPAWCYYDNDPENVKKYGKLYNWFAVNDPRGLAPEGWHIPSNVEWNILEDFLGKDIAGYKMKSYNGWDDWMDDYGEIKNGNGDDSSGFNGLPGGWREKSGSFYNNRHSACFWSAVESANNYFAWSHNLAKSLATVYRLSHLTVKSCGASVRCLRDDYLFI